MPKLTDKNELTTLAQDDWLHAVDVSDTSGSAEGTSKKVKVSEVKPPDNCRIGILDYNDTATTGTPLVVTVVGSPVPLPNDELGSFTNKLYTAVGVTDVWDASAGEFDFSDLKLGDMIDIRLDVILHTTSVNTQIDIALRLGLGASEYRVPFITEANFKNTGDHPLTNFNGIYMGDTNTLNNGAYFEITTDKDCTLTVNGWYCKVLVRG